MLNISASTSTSQPTVGLASAVITGQADKWFFLDHSESPDGAIATGRALRAESCLLAPTTGDTVLVCSGVSVGVTSVSYILAVLSRADPQQGVLTLPGGVALTADHGRLTLAAQQISLEGGQAVSVAAPAVTMAAVEANMSFHKLATTVKDLRATLGSLQTVAQSINSTVGRLMQKATNSFRWTENLDETRAGRMRLDVAERFHLKSRHASVIAEGQVKIDGEKIDLG